MTTNLSKRALRLIEAMGFKPDQKADIAASIGQKYGKHLWLRKPHLGRLTFAEVACFVGRSRDPNYCGPKEWARISKRLEASK